ncbi:MAG: BPL-N domain-containing protein [Verrucomicrobiales bacterium]
MFPGGSGSKQAAGLGEAGREKVRAFVAGGGAYLGICAGCYLACENFSWSLKILDAKTRSSKWERGKAVLDLGFEGGAESLFGLDAKVEVRYQNGPVMEPAHSPDIPDFETIAVFGSEVAKNGTPKRPQVGTPAILRHLRQWASRRDIPPPRADRCTAANRADPRQMGGRARVIALVPAGSKRSLP